MSSIRSPIGRPVIGRPRHSSQNMSSPSKAQTQQRSTMPSPSPSPSHGGVFNSNNPRNHHYRARNDNNFYNSHQHNDNNYIPEVPRIPNRFLRHLHHHTEEENHRGPSYPGPAQQQQQQQQLEVVQQRITTVTTQAAGRWEESAAPHTRYLPNCSFGRPKEVQVISNAMMRTYIAMRGNWLGSSSSDDDDPLFEWIRRREELAGIAWPKIDPRRDVERMLRHIDRALESSDASSGSPRDCVFEVYRPDFEHIKPPADMDMSANEFAACCADFEWEDDSDEEEDDQEANVPSGRISPCTFLEWSRGCERWNADGNVKKEDTTSYSRMRPPTPRIRTRLPSIIIDRHRHHLQHQAQHQHYRHRHEDRPRTVIEAQRDINTGEELTPTYRVPTSPSIIYTPPGIEFTGFCTADFHAQYKRMAPLVERELRSHIYGHVDLPPNLPDGERDRFSATEVDAAALIVPELQGRAGAEIDATLREQWAQVLEAERTEQALRAHATAQVERLDRLRQERRHLGEFLPALRVRRDIRDQAARHNQWDERTAQQQQQQQGRREVEIIDHQRDERRDTGRGDPRTQIQSQAQTRRDTIIRAHVAQHAIEAQGRLDTALTRLASASAAVDQNNRRIEEVERDVRDLCCRAGVRDPDHAYAVLMGDESVSSSNESRGMGGVVYEGTNFGASGGVAYGVGADVHNYGFDGQIAGGRYGGPGYENRGFTNEHGPVPVMGVDAGAGAGIPPVGPWSPSSLGRAGDEFDRFMAGIRMQEAWRGQDNHRHYIQNNNNDTQINVDDECNESGDSGVAGVEIRQQQARPHLNPYNTSHPYITGYHV